MQQRKKAKTHIKGLMKNSAGINGRSDPLTSNWVWYFSGSASRERMQSFRWWMLIPRSMSRLQQTAELALIRKLRSSSSSRFPNITKNRERTLTLQLRRQRKTYRTLALHFYRKKNIDHFHTTRTHWIIFCIASFIYKKTHNSYNNSKNPTKTNFCLHGKLLNQDRITSIKLIPMKPHRTFFRINRVHLLL